MGIIKLNQLQECTLSLILKRADSDNSKIVLGEVNYKSCCLEKKRIQAIMNQSTVTQTPINALELPLDREGFFGTLIRELSGTLQELVGLEEASGFISVVGQTMSREIDKEYKSALKVSNLSRQQVSEVLVDLKKRIKGGFYIIEESDKKIVFGNHNCPFGEKVIGRPSMCMMTSNVFGSIAADNLGYAKVELQETIANGNFGCRIVVYLEHTEEAEEAVGREYFKG